MSSWNNLDHPAVKKAINFKEKGNELFKKGDYGKAIEEYSRGITSLESAEKVVCPIGATLYNNRAACHQQNRNFEGVIKDSREVLKMPLIDNQTKIKALLRRATAYETCDKPIEALADMRAILAIDSSVSQAMQSIGRLQQQARDIAVILIGDIKTKGNGFFKQQNYADAVIKYEAGLKLIAEHNLETRKEAREVQQSLLNNSALCYIKLNQFEDAVRVASEVLDRDSNHTKALFRRGIAFNNLNKLDEAKRDLTLAVKNAKGDDVVTIQKELDSVCGKM